MEARRAEGLSATASSVPGQKLRQIRQRLRESGRTRDMAHLDDVEPEAQDRSWQWRQPCGPPHLAFARYAKDLTMVGSVASRSGARAANTRRDATTQYVKDLASVLSTVKR